MFLYDFEIRENIPVSAVLSCYHARGGTDFAYVLHHLQKEKQGIQNGARVSNLKI